MMLFPEWLFTGVVVGGVVVTALGAIVLAALWLKDLKGKTLW